MIGMAEILEQSDSDTAAGLFWVSGLCGRLLGSQPSGSKRGIFCFHALGDNVFAIAFALRLPRVSVVRRLDELIKHGYVERVRRGVPRCQ